MVQKLQWTCNLQSGSTMPSASSQSSMQITGQMEGNDLTKSALNLLEKKVRNLEKRKGKLDFYKKLVKDGEALNEDQKIAVGQLHQVEQNLEFARDLQKQLAQMYLENQKLQKKMAKRDQAAMLVAQHDSDVSKVCQVLELQALMDNLSEDVRVDFLNGSNGAVVVTEESFVQIDNFYKLITPNPDAEESMKEQQLAASQHIVNFLESSPDPVVETTYKALNELVSSIKKCGYFDQPQTEEEEEAVAEEEPDEAEDQGLAADGDAASTEEENKVQEPINRSPEGQLNGSDAAQSADTSSNKGGENVAALANNELGLNFLSESEVESKPESATEPLVPADSPAAPAPPEESGYRAPVSGDEGWVEQRGEGHLGNEAGGETGFDTVQHSNGFSRGGRGGRGGFRGREGGFGRRGGPPGDRGNRRGRGGFAGPPRGGGRGGFGQQQDNYQRRGGSGGRGPRGGGGPSRGGQRGGRRGGGFPQQ